MASVIKVDTIKSTTGNTALTISESGVPQLNVPMFSVRHSSNFSLTSAVTTLVPWNQTVIDTHEWYNSATGAYSPATPGYYQFNTWVLAQASASMGRILLRFYKNGIQYTSVDVQPGAVTQGGASLSVVDYMNGADSMSVYAYVNGTSPLLVGGTLSGFSGFLVRAA